MSVFIGNTGILRVTDVKTTELDGTITPLNESGTFTIYDGEGRRCPASRGLLD